MLPFLTNIISGTTGTILNSVGNVLDKVVTTKAEKLQLDNELKKAEQHYQTEMKRLGIEEQRLTTDDRDSARKREASIATSATATGLSKNISPFLALGTTALTLALFLLLIFRPDLILAESKEIVLYILGVLSAVLSQIFGYYFGSSAGSALKTELLNTKHSP